MAFAEVRARWRAGTGSLFFRTALTLALALIVFQAAALWVVYRTVIVPVAEQSADDLAGLIVLSAQTWAELPPITRPAFVRELDQRHGLILSTQALPAPGSAADFAFRGEIEDALGDRLDDDVTLLSTADDPVAWVEVPVGEHRLWVGFLPQRYAMKLPVAAVAMVALGTLLSLLTALFLVRRLTVPLARAAAAARQVGAGELPAPLPETGPSELVELARRFNHMGHEVRELLDNRTTLLAGISHDLRTPMTRLRLNLELLREQPAPQRIDRALADLEAMNALIAGYLELARSRRAEARVSGDIVPRLSEIAAETGVRWEDVAPCRLTVAPLALQQILRNLIENARRYGGEKIPELRLETTPETVTLIVRDFGPGLAEDQLEKVFRPFYRIEASRSASTGGSGLGLAIARQLAESQGWRLSLKNRPDGLDAVLEIPRQAA